MIKLDEKTILIEKLKDTALDYLRDQMREDLGKLSEEFQNKLNDRVLEWVKASHPYFSTSEFRKAYKELCQEYQMIYYCFFTGSNHKKQLEKFDEYYKLDDSKLMPNIYYTVSPTYSGPNYTVSTRGNNLPKKVKFQQQVKKSKKLLKYFKSLPLKKSEKKPKKLTRRMRNKGSKAFV